MSSEKVHVEHCKGVNGLDKVILREIRRCSAEVTEISFFVVVLNVECALYYKPEKKDSRRMQAKIYESIGGNSTKDYCQTKFKVYLYGGQVTSWKNAHGEELLFVSSKASFRPPRAIRGGIPICFPQLKSTGSLEQYGFARNRIWSIDPDPPPSPSDISHKAFVDLILTHSEEDMKIWPHRYEYRLRVALGPTGDLMLTSCIRNTSTGGKSFTFRFAYQTYFFVTDISEVRVEGLETLDYLDNLKNGERFTEQEDAITFESEVDKVYLSTPTKIAILDHERKRTFELRKYGLPDAEAACVEEPITLKPGEEWKGRQEISAVPSSYCSEQLDPRRLLLSG
ncbi:putative glucose-6-phosphate 1-epimerase isoform X2 [Gossypium arboreum]|uniref:putative glucose-6-phosphate 1-epimerase isoform X2 n=1 Tax=Gossypium arboreum TaxID=29729 RepID=UPI0022F1514B|nr:putative glucose-6-phosphate 1-epimerase isoform X2 [Gossypium arboreum]